MKDTVVLHLSDLHFGIGFAEKKWDQLTEILKAAPPSLIVVTGDVVNHPSVASLKHANQKLDQFRAALVAANSGQDIPLVYIPGNHDTRIFGLVPLYWLIALSAITAAVSAFLLFTPLDIRWSAAILLLAMVPLIARMFFTNNLRKIFGDKLLVEPTAFHKLRVGVVPLDSSVTRWYGAYGRVSNDVATILHRTFADAQNRKLFWIAAVHHHPLPIPCDHAWESTMLLKNAGTVLQNLIHHHIPLVLHGHKHHQHFSRFFLRDRTYGEREISVLSAGSPTHARHPTRMHSFNTITIDMDHRARVDVYESDQGAAFHKAAPFLVSSQEIYRKRRFEEYCDTHSIAAERLVRTISIDEFGGAIWAEEFSGLTTKSAIRKFPYHFRVGCDTGHIFSGESHADHGPQILAVISYGDNNTVLADVTFNPGWQPAQRDFHYRLEYRILNFCALDSVQFENMYFPGDENFFGDVEHVNFDVPDRIAVKEFLITLKFPHGAPLPEDVWCFTRTGETLEEWAVSTDTELVRIHSASSVMVRVYSPKPGASFQLKWRVHKSNSSVSAQGLACEKGLLAIDRKWLADYESQIKMSLGDVRAVAQASFVKAAGDFKGYSISVTVFSYDRQARMLKKSFGLGDDLMRGGGFRYGLGLPGLALKARRVVFYDKNLILRYKPIPHPPNLLIDAERFDIEQETEDCVAVPLYCEADTRFDQFGKVSFQGLPYGVLKISFAGLDSHKAFFDISNSFAQAAFSGAVSQIMYDLVKSAILAPAVGDEIVKR